MSLTRLYLGTQYGLRIWHGDTDDWEEQQIVFDKKVVDTIDGSLDKPLNVFIGIAHEGLYRTVDGGKSWQKVFSGDVRAVTVDPTDGKTVYAGTEPVHLFKSQDLGGHWKEVDALLNLPQEVKTKWRFPRPPHQGHVRQIFIDPQNPGVIYLALEHGGIVRTFNGGSSWQDVSQGIDYLDIHFVANFPDDPSLFFASTARGFYSSREPADGWQRAENGLDKNFCYNLVFFPGNPTVMLLATGDGSPAFWERPGVARSSIYRSSNGAQSWQPASGGMPLNMEAMPWAMAAHPRNGRSAFAGFGQVSRGRAEVDSSQDWEKTAGQLGSVWGTFDRGESWKELAIKTAAIRSMWATDTIH
jgi:photosystem II stability/assembly factor-like uncharacterized protein